MRFSEAWLKEYYTSPLATEELVQQLTMAGLEVDSVEPVAGKFNGVVVGEVVQIIQHPNADKLRICSVAVNAEENLNIVCGASNVMVNGKYPVAMVGAILPGDFKIKKSKLRGEPSYGMLCSASELGLASESSGLMTLPADAPVGVDLRDYLDLDDKVIDVDLTPNRADCLSIEGIAREVAVLAGNSFLPAEMPVVGLGHEEQPALSIHVPDACPRFLARIIRGLDPDAETPLWMRERLRRSGIRSLGPVVDVTNYVLLEMGQPLHAYDAGKIRGGLNVRYATDGEKLVLLDGQEIRLNSSSLVIADDQVALSLAGVMGGEGTAVSETTRDVLLECAYFNPSVIMGKARSYGLHTDSSHRFERGVDFDMQHRAIERATELILAIAGGSVGPVRECVDQAHLPVRTPILLRKEKISALLSVELPDSEVELILGNLGMHYQAEESGWSVTPPDWRFDVAIEADLLEELARVWGYDRIPMSSAMSSSSHAMLDVAENMPERIKDLLVDRGYSEAITYSFVDPVLQGLLFPGVKTIVLKNPISSDLSEMRLSIWPGLLQAAQKNSQRQRDRIRLFEAGLCFAHAKEQGGEFSQKPHLAGIASGALFPEQWGLDTRNVDFFDIKADVEAVLNFQKISADFRASDNPALHPGQSAKIEIAGREVGWVGMLHPEIQKELGFTHSVYLFDLALDINNIRLPAFVPLSKFPSVRRDLALIVEAEVQVGELLSHVESLSLEYLRSVTVFDVYSGENMNQGYKSIGLALNLNAATKTLTDSEIDAIVKSVLDNLIDKFNVRLRD